MDVGPVSGAPREGRAKKKPGLDAWARWLILPWPAWRLAIGQDDGPGLALGILDPCDELEPPRLCALGHAQGTQLLAPAGPAGRRLRPAGRWKGLRQGWPWSCAFSRERRHTGMLRMSS